MPTKKKEYDVQLVIYDLSKEKTKRNELLNPELDLVPHCGLIVYGKITSSCQGLSTSIGPFSFDTIVYLFDFYSSSDGFKMQAGNISIGELSHSTTQLPSEKGPG